MHVWFYFFMYIAYFIFYLFMCLDLLLYRFVIDFIFRKYLLNIKKVVCHPCTLINPNSKKNPVVFWVTLGSVCAAAGMRFRIASKHCSYSIDAHHITVLLWKEFLSSHTTFKKVEHTVLQWGKYSYIANKNVL